MKSTSFRVLLAALFAAAATSVSAQAPAAKTPAPDAKPAAATKPAKPAHARYPFHGIVKAVDAKAVTVTLEGKEHDRVLRLDGETRLSKDAKDITLTGVAAGDYLHGTVTKNSREEEVIVRAQAGPKPAPKDKAKADEAPKAPAKDKAAK
jgi:hypothetical protein